MHVVFVHNRQLRIRITLFPSIDSAAATDIAADDWLHHNITITITITISISISISISIAISIAIAVAVDR